MKSLTRCHFKGVAHVKKEHAPEAHKSQNDLKRHYLDFYRD